MTNILSFTAIDGREVQISQKELKTEEGREWLEEQINTIKDDTKQRVEEEVSE